MPIDVVWDNEEKTILRFIRRKGWTVEDYYASITEGENMLKNLGYKVHVIHDATEAPQMPPNALTHFRNGNGRLAPYSVRTAIVGNSLFMEALFDMFRQLNAHISGNFIMENSVEAAREKLAEEPITKPTTDA